MRHLDLFYEGNGDSSSSNAAVCNDPHNTLVTEKDIRALSRPTGKKGTIEQYNLKSQLVRLEGRAAFTSEGGISWLISGLMSQ
jgi:hypothetical protein